VLTDSEDSSVAREAAVQLGLHLPSADPRGHRRPAVMIADGQVGLVLMVLGAQHRQHPLRVYARDGGLLLVGDDVALDAVRPALSPGRTDPWSVLVDIVLAVARHCEEALERIDDESQELEARATGYSSAPQRRTMGRLRTELFRIGETQVAQQTLLSADEEFAQEMGDEHRRLIARAATAFGANHSTTTRLYAMLGDVLNEQDTVVSERLTLVATIFLPLTLTTGFFGMNFPWLTDRVGGLTAFLLFGLVVPAALTIGTLVLVRRLTRSA
jgi:hypothetical protein